MDASSFNVNVLKEKPRIVNYIGIHGPSVSPAIAKALGLNSFLASALVSELLSDKLIRASSLRVGGSPLYYIAGQEAMVENFIKYLPGKEREAFLLIKKEEILEDSKQEPAIRVALRAIKDFAVPLKIYFNNEEKIFWKLHTLTKEEFEKRMNILLSPPKEEKAEQKIEQRVEQKEMIKESLGEKEEIKEKKKKKKKRQIKSRNFDFIVDSWLRDNHASIIELSKDGKNAHGRISIPGKGEHIILARNKKSLDEFDLLMANQMGLNGKLPVILLSTGKMSKKAEEIFTMFREVMVHRL